MLLKKSRIALCPTDQHAFSACGIGWSAQGCILGPRNSRHVFRRDAIEVRLHTLLSHIVVHSRFSPIWALAELAKSGLIRELPPATTIVCPVRNHASSVHGSAHTFATSAGVTRRDEGG